MSNPPLTVHNAEIKTAAVEVRTLTISGKQVTLAVFRQLREARLITEDGTLNGVPWGVVNYHPDKCGADAQHWHVVWQRGTELLRSLVYPHCPWRDRYFQSTQGMHLFAIQLRDTLLGALPKGETIAFNPEDAHVVLPELYGIPSIGGVSAAARKAMYAIADQATLAEMGSRGYEDTKCFRGLRNPSGSPWLKAKDATPLAEGAIKSALDALARQLGPNATYEQMTTRYAAEIETEAGRRRRYEGQLDAIADLPQLFIAV